MHEWSTDRAPIMSHTQRNERIIAPNPFQSPFCAYPFQSAHFQYHFRRGRWRRREGPAEGQSHEGHPGRLQAEAAARRRIQGEWGQADRYHQYGNRVFGGLMATRLQPQNFPKIRAGWPYSEPRLMQLERLAFWEWLNQLRKLSKLVRLNSWQVSPQSCLNLIRYEGHIMMKWLDYICIEKKEWMKGFIKIIWML